MSRYLVVFLSTVTALFWFETTPMGQERVVLPFTEFVAEMAVGIVQHWDESATASGKIIADTVSGFAISIEPGCNGIEPIIILTSAIVAFHASWRHKAIGIAIGISMIYAINLVRIVSLFYLGQWNESVFEWMHLYVWQALIMLDALISFLIWMRWVRIRETLATRLP